MDRQFSEEETQASITTVKWSASPVTGEMQIKTTLHTTSPQSEMSVIKMSDNKNQRMWRDRSSYSLLGQGGCANYRDQFRGSSKIKNRATI